MTARKPKPKPRKASGPTLEQRVAAIEAWSNHVTDRVNTSAKRLDALESRASLRDKSHDEPVSNAGEAIGQHFSIVGTPSWWRRFLNFMGAP